jgi:hypothetical protein
MQRELPSKLVYLVIRLSRLLINIFSEKTTWVKRIMRAAMMDEIEIGSALAQIETKIAERVAHAA